MDTDKKKQCQQMLASIFMNVKAVARSLNLRMGIAVFIAVTGASSVRRYRIIIHVVIDDVLG